MPTSEAPALFGSYFEPSQPVVVPATSEEQTQAALFTASLWQHITRAGGPRPTRPECTLVRGAFTAEWLADLTLPSREHIPEGQNVTLANGGFVRYDDRNTLADAYQQEPRTWIFERAHHVIPWLNLAAQYLGKLSSSPLEVLAAVFDSRHQDDAPHAHTDEWYSAIVQVAGAKTWTAANAQRLTTEPGDVLLIPEGVVHAAATPPEPGASRHIVFGLCRHTAHTRINPEQLKPADIATAA